MRQVRERVDRAVETVWGGRHACQTLERIRDDGFPAGRRGERVDRALGSACLNRQLSAWCLCNCCCCD